MLLQKIVLINLTQHFQLEKLTPDEPDAIVRVVPMEWLPSENTIAMQDAFKDDVELDEHGKPILDADGNPKLRAGVDEGAVLRRTIKTIAPSVKAWNLETEDGVPIPLPKVAAADTEEGRAAFQMIWRSVPMRVLHHIFEVVAETQDVPPTK